MERYDLDLIKMFSDAATGLKGAVDGLWKTATEAGLSMGRAGILRGVLFGYVETYLNGATCGLCFANLGDARNFGNFTLCPYCGKKAPVVKISPIRFYLSIANNADFFDVVPEKIRANQKMLSGLGRYSEGVMEFYDSVDLSEIMVPLLAWMKDRRPDLFYTLAFYPTVPDYIQILYDLRFDNLDKDAQDLIAADLGLESRKDIEGVLIKAMDLAIERRSIYLIMSDGEYLTKTDSKEEAEAYIKEREEKEGNRKLKYIKMSGVNSYALKVFYRQVEELKNKMRYVLMDALGV